MSSERTLASTFFAAVRLSSAEFAGEMQFLLPTCRTGLFGAENRKRLPFAVAGYLRYKGRPVAIERTHDMVAQFRNYRADLIFHRRDFIRGSIFEVNCD
jgi:hypothetical protein